MTSSKDAERLSEVGAKSTANILAICCQAPRSHGAQACPSLTDELEGTNLDCPTPKLQFLHSLRFVALASCHLSQAGQRSTASWRLLRTYSSALASWRRVCGCESALCRHCCLSSFLHRVGSTISAQLPQPTGRQACLMRPALQMPEIQ